MGTGAPNDDVEFVGRAVIRWRTRSKARRVSDEAELGLEAPGLRKAIFSHKGVLRKPRDLTDRDICLAWRESRYDLSARACWARQ